jgi:hypothetical protein
MVRKGVYLGPFADNFLGRVFHKFLIFLSSSGFLKFGDSFVQFGKGFRSISVVGSLIGVNVDGNLFKMLNTITLLYLLFTSSNVQSGSTSRMSKGFLQSVN